MTNVTEELDGYRDWEQSTLGKALLRIANTDEAFVKLRDERDSIASERDALQAEIVAERRCEMCHFDRRHAWRCYAQVSRPTSLSGSLDETRASFYCSEWKARGRDNE